MVVQVPSLVHAHLDDDDLIAGKADDHLQWDARRGLNHDEGAYDGVVSVVEAALVDAAELAEVAEEEVCPGSVPELEREAADT
jgi:hypothetical protein